MNFFPDFAPNSRKEWRLLLFQSNLRKQIRKLPKFLKFVRIIHYYSKLFTGVLNSQVPSTHPTPGHKHRCPRGPRTSTETGTGTRRQERAGRDRPPAGRWLPVQSSRSHPAGVFAVARPSVRQRQRLSVNKLRHFGTQHFSRSTNVARFGIALTSENFSKVFRRCRFSESISSFQRFSYGFMSVSKIHDLIIFFNCTTWDPVS